MIGALSGRGVSDRRARCRSTWFADANQRSEVRGQRSEVITSPSPARRAHGVRWRAHGVSRADLPSPACGRGAGGEGIENQVDALFLMSDRTGRSEPWRDGDTLWLPCADDYASLPQKTLWFCRWAVASLATGASTRRAGNVSFRVGDAATNGTPTPWARLSPIAALGLLIQVRRRHLRQHPPTSRLRRGSPPALAGLVGVPAQPVLAAATTWVPSGSRE